MPRRPRRIVHAGVEVELAPQERDERNAARPDALPQRDPRSLTTRKLSSEPRHPQPRGGHGPPRPLEDVGAAAGGAGRTAQSVNVTSQGKGAQAQRRQRRRRCGWRTAGRAAAA